MIHIVLQVIFGSNKNLKECYWFFNEESGMFVAFATLELNKT